MEKIIVVDNFLEKDDLEKTMTAVKNIQWTFGHKSNHSESNETPFWSASLSNDPLFTDVLFQVIQKTFHKKFKINRVYVNGQSFGQDGGYHIDDADEDCYSFVLYTHDILESDVELAGGHIYFKLHDLQYKICYEPVLNRGILFPSNYIHRACSFSRYIMELRTCVAWKLKEIKDA